MYLTNIFNSAIANKTFSEELKFAEIGQHLSALLSGFRKGFSSQHALFCTFEKWHKYLDSGNIVDSILMDLSKAFDCIKYDLLIAKLHAYGRSKASL